MRPASKPNSTMASCGVRTTREAMRIRGKPNSTTSCCCADTTTDSYTAPNGTSPVTPSPEPSQRPDPTATDTPDPDQAGTHPPAGTARTAPTHPTNSTNSTNSTSSSEQVRLTNAGRCRRSGACARLLQLMLSWNQSSAQQLQHLAAGTDQRSDVGLDAEHPHHLRFGGNADDR
ncbi:MAG: hypothetical protein ACI8Y4_001597 [Candidatus Poriferisodalaceae bacterium]|jgi:hypothetical protein